MATEKRLIEQLLELANVTPPVCQYDKPEKTMIFGKEITVYCKPFEQFQELLRRAADALSVDAVEVSRLGKLGRLMMPYTGCPRGMFGTRGVSGVDDHKMVIVTELDPIIDVDGDRWVPVLDSDLASLKANVQNSVEVVRCKDCKYFKDWGDGNKTCDYWTDQWDCATDEDAFCSYGERKTYG